MGNVVVARDGGRFVEFGRVFVVCIFVYRVVVVVGVCRVREVVGLGFGGCEGLVIDF